jgi:hypothetical protein
MSSFNSEEHSNHEDDLTTSELAARNRLETVAQHGLGTYLQVGTALAEIRDRHLYRHSHASFEAYLRERWADSIPNGELPLQTAMGAEHDTTPAPEQDGRPARNSKPGEALAKACEETLAALAGDDHIGIEIRVAFRSQNDPGAPADGLGVERSEDGQLVERELLSRLRWLLTEATGTIGLIGHQLESRGDDIDDDARAQLRDDVLVLDDELATVKALLMELVDWDFELERLLDDEVPPFDVNTHPDDD